jgi:hypothetical protein
VDPAFQALVEQATRVCARHPELIEFYVRAIRDKGKGMPDEALEALVKQVAEARPTPTATADRGLP